jgi:adenine-specific DNA-methyltransferase
MTQRLELIWPHKNEHVLRNSETGKWEFCGSDLLPVHPLIEVEAYGDEQSRPFDPNRSNLLIKGENLFALQSLLPYYAGKINFIYLDPPYNTGNEFEAYEDNYEHSIWLGMMAERLRLLRLLLKPNGVFAVHIDDSESAYLKVLLDDVFGRENHLITLYIQVRYPEKTLKQDMSFHKLIEHIHVYKNGEKPSIKQEEQAYSFDKFKWQIVEKTMMPEKIELGNKVVEIFRPGEYEIVEIEPQSSGLKEIWASGAILDGNSSGRFFRDFLGGREQSDGYGILYKVYGIGDDGLGYRYFTGPKRKGATKGKYYQGVPLGKVENGEPRLTPLPNFLDFAASFGNCRHEGGVELRSGKKPEALLSWLIDIFSVEDDRVLDCFAGSGTTGAVAHKMRRRWVMVELNDQAENRALIRLKNVVDGLDPTGISQEFEWNGGGGFRFLEVGAPLFIKDPSTQLTIVNPQYTNGPLIRAVCAVEGFLLTGDSWLHGQNGHHFAHITEEFVDDALIKQLKQRLEPGQMMLTIYAAKGVKRDLTLPEGVFIKSIHTDLLKRYGR